MTCETKINFLYCKLIVKSCDNFLFVYNCWCYIFIQFACRYMINEIKFFFKDFQLFKMHVQIGTDIHEVILKVKV